MRVPFLASLLVVLIAAPHRPVSAQSSSGAYLVRLGADTTGIERVWRIGDSLWADVLLRVPETERLRMRASFTPDGRLRGFHQTTHRYRDGHELLAYSTVVVDVVGDTARMVITEDGKAPVESRARADRPVVPWTSWFGILDFVLPLVPGDPGDTLAFRLLAREGGRMATIVRRSRDSLDLQIFRQLGTAVLGADGAIARAEYLNTTNKYVAERVAGLDVDDVALAFHEADRASRGLGRLSPRDSSEISVGGARFVLAYGRPAKRGRVVFGGIVPHGAVWRTGADWATFFATDRTLTFEGLVIPPGRYTLWTVPGPETWQLVINGETGQFGTEYKAARDVGRIRMRGPEQGPLQERLRLGIVPTTDGAELVLAWDTTVVRAPFRIGERR